MQQTLTSELVGERNEKCNPSYWYLANDKLFDFEVIISIKDRNYLQFAKKKYILKVWKIFIVKLSPIDVNDVNWTATLQRYSRWIY